MESPVIPMLALIMAAILNISATGIRKKVEAIIDGGVFIGDEVDRLFNKCFWLNAIAVVLAVIGIGWFTGLIISENHKFPL